jgi:DNA polymerase-3 subunit gamma/tau
MTALNVPACSSGAARKVLILENVDRMHEPSGNSLLKLLEEPPQDAYLILITTRPGALIPTVRSRLRSYPFTERSREAEEEVLKRIFHEEGQDYQGLREYFLFWKDINPQALRGLARRFVEGVLASAVESEEEPGAGGILEDLEKAVKAGAGKSRTERAFASSFFEELLRQLHLLLREGALDSFRLERWNQAIREHLYALQRFNQQPMLTLESLYYTLRAAE